jgi:hypothetical protein
LRSHWRWLRQRFPLQSSLVLILFWCFCVTLWLLFEMLWGTFIYAFLGQDHQVDLWMDGCGARGGKDPRWHDQRWASHHLGSCSLLSSVCKVPRLQNVRLRKILILEKCLVLFDPYRSLKVKKIHKVGISCSSEL